MEHQCSAAAGQKFLKVHCADAVGARLADVRRTCALEPAIELVPLGDIGGEARGSERGPAVCAVGLAGTSASAAELLLISRLTSVGSHVVCYGEATPSAPLAERCQLLLAGAREILDCRALDFSQQLLATLQTVCRQANARLAERSRLSDLMRRSGVAGESEAMYAVFRSVERVSVFTGLPVLITGETGTGKDLAAQSIHRLDTARSRQPFVPVNCGALELELAGSDLFGHRRGSFTGASHDRPGLFRAADQGVLFLDEVGELSLALQAKLLRVLQTRRVLGVGEDRETDVNVRVIAATNRDLRGMVRDGSFREDLFHRLSVTEIHIPPLRERPADIAPLLEHFLHRLSADGEHPPLRAAADVLHLIERSRLPGNARQIENLVHHALIHHEQGPEIRGGLYREGRQYLNVNRGTGCVGLPFRLNMPSELSLIVVRSDRVRRLSAAPAPVLGMR